LQSLKGGFTVKYGDVEETFVEDDLGTNQTYFEKQIASKYEFLLVSAPNQRGQTTLTKSVLDKKIMGCEGGTYIDKLLAFGRAIEQQYGAVGISFEEYSAGKLATCIVVKSDMQRTMLEGIYPGGKCVDGQYHTGGYFEKADASDLLDFLAIAKEVKEEQEEEDGVVTGPSDEVEKEPLTYNPMPSLAWMHKDLNELCAEERVKLLWVKPTYEGMFSKGMKAKFFGMMAQGPLEVNQYLVESRTNYGNILDALPDCDKLPFLVGRCLQFKGQIGLIGKTLAKKSI